METRAPVEGRFSCAHVIDGTRPLMGQDGQRLALAMLLLQSSQIFLPPWVIPEEQHSRFREGPREGGVADFRARSAIALASGFLRTCDHATRGDARLHPGEALQVVDLIEPHQSQDLADTGYGLPPVEGVRVVRCGRLHNGPLERTE